MAKMEIEGVEDLVKELEMLGAKGRKVENIALKSAGERVRETIVGEAPVRTGNLQRSISLSSVKNREGVKYVEVGPDKNGWYSKFVEFGTVKTQANPFVSRGYEQSKDEALSIIKDELKKGLGL